MGYKQPISHEQEWLSYKIALIMNGDKNGSIHAKTISGLVVHLTHDLQNLIAWWHLTYNYKDRDFCDMEHNFWISDIIFEAVMSQLRRILDTRTDVASLATIIKLIKSNKHLVDYPSLRGFNRVEDLVIEDTLIREGKDLLIEDILCFAATHECNDPVIKILDTEVPHIEKIRTYTNKVLLHNDSTGINFNVLYQELIEACLYVVHTFAFINSLFLDSSMALNSYKPWHGHTDVIAKLEEHTMRIFESPANLVAYLAYPETFPPFQYFELNKEQ